MPDYYELPELPGKKFFRCDRYNANLSTETCADNWRAGNHEGIESRLRCKVCPLGALHAGETAASMSPLKGMLICGRCHTGAARLIAKHLCVSCYNRQREYVIGRNAKGTRPTKLAPLDARRIRYMSGNSPKILALNLSVDTEELIITALRDSKDKVRFGFLGDIRGIPAQLRLW
ncbi:hypothetical protein AWB80_07521 [Caballeronia pedi]|uniref:Uncharacterized protein n=1 Tax=Caballeronia pedi TaxID=1777141 RepID=A0A158DV21_9BURK|nr:hypothetical protein [Caballeronia pedi]SAK98445.1 hypothetical protein AWB80_07521 [Caballeronia pedi]